MKKLMVALMIAIIVSVVGCTDNKNVDTQQEKNSSSSDETKTKQTSPKNDNMGDISKGLEDQKNNIQKLYLDLEGEFDKQTSNFKQETWEKFSYQFNQSKEGIKKKVTENVYLSTAIDNLEKLYNEYNNALRKNIQIGKDRIEGIKNSIEENLKKIPVDMQK